MVTRTYVQNVCPNPETTDVSILQMLKIVGFYS